MRSFARIASSSVVAIALFASAFSMGCSDAAPSTPNGGATAGTNPNAGPVPTGFELSCRATINAAKATFTADATSLVLTMGGGSQTLAREGGNASGGTSIIGTWTLPTAPIDGDPAYIARTGLAIHATAIVDASSITTVVDCSSNWVTIHARASSPITIADSSVTIRESHEQVRKWTSAGGDQVVSASSVAVFDAPETASENALGASFPAF